MKHTSVAAALLATLFLVFNHQAHAQNSTTPPDRQGFGGDNENPAPTLVGGIRSLTVRSYYAGGTLESPATYGVNVWMEYEFNGRGDVVVQRVLWDDGTLSHTIHHRYNPAGYILEDVELSPEGDTLSHHLRTYDSDNLLTSSTLTNGYEALASRYEYQDGKVGRTTVFDLHDPTNEIESTTYEYGDKGELTRKDIESHYENLHLRYDYTYGEGTTTTDHFTTQLGQEFPTHYRSRTICTYSPEGRLLSEVILGVAGSQQGEVAFTYDTRGNITSKVGTGVERTYHHTYDPLGNITRTIVTSDDDVKAIIEYTIAYFE